MKAFKGYHCDACNSDFDVDSCVLKEQHRIDPQCIYCECDDKVRRVFEYID